MNSTGKVGLSTSCWIAAARISDGNKSVRPKHMSIAGYDVSDNFDLTL